MLPVLPEASDLVWKKVAYTDGARWYGDACRWPRMPHYVYGKQWKKMIDRFIPLVKDRTEYFDDHFPCRRAGCDRRHVWNWLQLFLLNVHGDGQDEVYDVPIYGWWLR
jgi:hypothetical protein